MEKTASEKERDLLPFDTIAAAVSGGEEALLTVVKHYDRYITKCASRERIDEDGRRIRYVDDELKRRMTAKLIMGILQFRLDREN